MQNSNQMENSYAWASMPPSSNSRVLRSNLLFETPSRRTWRQPVDKAKPELSTKSSTNVKDLMWFALFKWTGHFGVSHTGIFRPSIRQQIGEKKNTSKAFPGTGAVWEVRNYMGDLPSLRWRTLHGKIQAQLSARFGEPPDASRAASDHPWWFLPMEIISGSVATY